MTNMIPIYTLMMATARNNGRRSAEQNEKLNELLAMQRINEKNDADGRMFDLAYGELMCLVDYSKSVNNDSDVEFDSKEFDKDGNLLIKTSGFKSTADQEKVIELYSPETGEMFFSHRQYTSISGNFDNYEYYPDAISYAGESLKNTSKMEKKAKLKAKRDAYREKAKSKMLKFKKFLGFGR